MTTARRKRPVSNDDVSSTAGSAADQVYSTVLGSIEQGVVLWSPDGVCEYVNEQARQIIEVPYEELHIGTLREDFLKFNVARGDMDDEKRAEVKAKFELRKPFSFTRNMPSGADVITHARFMDDGRIVVTFSDVTDQVKRQAAAQASHDAAEQAHLLVQDMMNSMEQGVIVWGGDMRCEMLSARVHDILELAPEQLQVGMLQEEFQKLVVDRGEVDPEKARQAMERLKRGKPFSLNRVLPSGRELISSARPRPEGGFVITYTDITEERRQERALASEKQRAERAEASLSVQLEELKQEKLKVESRQNELARLSLVAMHAKDIVIVTDAQSSVEWVNMAFEGHTGRNLRDVSGAPFLETITCEETDPDTVGELTTAVQERRISKAELLCAKASGDQYWMEIELIPVFGEDGVHTNFIIVGRDTTLRRANRLAAEEARRFEARKRDESRLLGDFSEWLQSSDNLDELLNVVSSFLAKLLPQSSGSVYIYANSRDVLDGVCSWNNGERLREFEPHDCWALRRGRPYYYGENSVDFVCNHAVEQYGDAVPEVYYCLPIVAHGDTVGLLHMQIERQDEKEATEARKLANFCAEQISLAIANVQLRDQLRDQSTRDPLTGLYNRRYFLESMRREIGRLSSYGKSGSLIAFDVDRFKRFNDMHGHDAGDVVLREISVVLQEMFRGRDVACRFGGEEFSIFLPEAKLEAGIARADDLRRAVENRQVRYSGESLSVSISCGVAAYPEHGASIQALINNADSALYQAKDGGRNCVVAFGANAQQAVAAE